MKFVLAIKEQQFQDAINSAMGMELTAAAQPAGQPNRPTRSGLCPAGIDGGARARANL